jgi:ABC-type branched-subunit amino acid transport system substrate-binding protein
MISEVMPYVWDDTLGIAKDYKNLPVKLGKPETLTYSGMEAYINARVLVEAMKLAGKNLTREKLIDTLENIRDYNISGYQLSYSPSNHNGSKFVEITVVGQNGKVMH